MLTLAAYASGEPRLHVGAGMLIIFVCAGSYRMLGVTLLTCFERDEFLLYILVRLLYVFFILGSGFVVPLFIPVLAFDDASLWPHSLGCVALSGVTLRAWGGMAVVRLLIACVVFVI